MLFTTLFLQQSRFCKLQAVLAVLVVAQVVVQAAVAAVLVDIFQQLHQ
jgi:hypothetical protein